MNTLDVLLANEAKTPQLCAVEPASADSPADLVEHPQN
jgi:hypothetical protein